MHSSRTFTPRAHGPLSANSTPALACHLQPLGPTLPTPAHCAPAAPPPQPAADAPRAAGGDQGAAGAADDATDTSGSAAVHATRKEGDAFVRKPEASPGGGGGGGVGETLERGWEELKRGGAKAPWADTQASTRALRWARRFASALLNM